MKRAIGSLNPALDGFDASCFDGVYITGDVTAETIAAMNSQRADSAEKIGDDDNDSDDADVSRLALPNPQET
jgi:amidophosphoribosyltransferase